MTYLPWPLSVPVISDGEVTLRAHTNDDIDPLVEMVTDPQTQSWTAVPDEYHERAAEQFLSEVVTPGWESGAHRIWVVEVNGQFVGQVDLKGSGPVKEIAYALHPAARGRGTMRAAVRLALNHAFTELETEVVHWRARVGNLASLRVAHACGFTMHAKVPRLLFERNQVHDAWTGSIAFGDAPYPRVPWAESVLEGERVRLRPVKPHDLPRWNVALEDPASQQYLLVVASALEANSSEARFAESQWHAAKGHTCTWAITDREKGEFQGLVIAVGLDDPYRGRAQLQWMLHPEARGRGFMKEAVRLATEHLINPDGYNQRRLSVFVAASNAASQGVAESAGFKQFGVQSKSEPLGDGEYDDLVEFELLP